MRFTGLEGPVIHCRMWHVQQVACMTLCGQPGIPGIFFRPATLLLVKHEDVQMLRSVHVIQAGIHPGLFMFRMQLEMYAMPNLNIYVQMVQGPDPLKADS